MAELVGRSQVARLREKAKAFEAQRRRARRAGGKPRAVVGFAGGGGSSVAWKMATGWDPDVAMNHWMTAVCAHQRHFPETEHHCADIFDVDPRSVLPGEHIAFAWFSPDCTDFSKAKGAAPKSERIRGLLWSILPWVATRRPDVIMIENVEEFEQAGPVYRRPDDWRAVNDRGRDGGELVPGEEGQPIQARRGETFQSFVAKLRRVGGVVEWRVINAADYGAPTTRKRLYVIVRFDGRPIVWPERTHAPRKDCERLGLKAWVGAHTIIDWGQDCPSIFLDDAEVDDLAKRTGKRVKRPLVAATQKRIARGMERYVIGSADPFLVNISQRNWGGDRAHGVRDPIPTLTSSRGGEYAVADPVAAMMTNNYGSNTRGGRGDLEEPTKTQTGALHSGVVEASLSPGGIVGVGGRRGQSPPVDPQAPMPTGTGKADAALAVANVVKFQENSTFTDPRDPTHTIMAGATRHGLVTSHLASVAHGDHDERAGLRAWPMDDPTRTQTGSHDKALVAGSLVRTNFHSAAARGGGHDQMVAASLHQMNTRDVGGDALDPARTLSGHDHQGLVAAHLDAYYSSGSAGSDAAAPTRSSTGQDRFSLVATWLEQANTGMVGHDQRDPVSTIVAGGGQGSGWGPTQRLIEARLELESGDHGGPVGRRGAVLDFLWRHFGVPTQAEWDDPAATLQGRLKFGLVLLPRRPSAGTAEDAEGALGARLTEGRGVSGDGLAASQASVRGAGEAGVPCRPQGGRSAVTDFDVWMIVDIGLRMLTPRELAAAMGLPADYDLSLDHLGRPISKTHQTQMIGNMVSPPPAAALIAANCPDLIQPGWSMAA